jgi:molybdopterin molybdotransferase
MAQLSDDCFAFGGALMSVEEALSLMAARVPALSEYETVPLAEADGRVLAADVPALLPLPPFFNSAVDGYAVRHRDLADAGPTRLTVAGRVAAGMDAAAADVQGQAIRVFTGAPMPAGADTVFMQEDVEVSGPAVLLPAGLKAGSNCRPAGEDLPQGARALVRGTRLGPAELALAAAAGHGALPVLRRPRVALFSTGDELAEPGQPLAAAAIPDANRIMLLSLLRRHGATVSDLGIVRDRADVLAERLREASRDHDLILTSGGVSTGEEDHVKAAVERVGTLTFWRLGIKPGRPVAMGTVGGAAFMGLPGNPVAVFVTFAYVARPLLALLAGTPARPPRPLPVRAGFSYAKKQGRREYVRVRLGTGADGLPVAHKHPRDGAGVITSLTECDGLVELAEERTRLSAGEMVPFHDFGQLLS